MEMVDELALQLRLDHFRSRIAAGAAPETLVREFITFGNVAVLDDMTYTHIREHAGAALGVHPIQSVYIIGSAKLGFSIKPSRRYGFFSDESDLDVAIVSAQIYEQLWSEARRFVRDGGLWEGDPRNHFKNDHVNAVIKPYVMPDSDLVPTKRVLFDLGSDLQRVGGSPYPVTVAVWHSMEALEEYQLRAVRQCQQEELGL